MADMRKLHDEDDGEDGNDISTEESAVYTKQPPDIERVELVPSDIESLNDPYNDKTMKQQDIVTNSTFVGRTINKICRQWERLNQNPKRARKELRPWFRGNSLCLGYVTWCSGKSKEPIPLLTIGPDWKFSLVEIFLMNLILGLASRNGEGLLQLITIGVLALQNIFFLATMTSNPGMLRRDPTIHTTEYLRYLAAKNQERAVCLRCNLIKPKHTKNIYHCEDCDVCVSGHDHHCPWSSKCIASGNLCQFYVFLTLTLACIVLLWINMFASQARKLTHHH